MTNVAILGCGMISGAYASTIHAFPHLDLVACADMDVVRAGALADEHGIPNVCSVDDLLDRDDVEIVVNLTPAAAHVPVTRAILESGKSAFSEKPLGSDLESARGLVDLAAARGLHLGCAPDTFFGVGLQTAIAAVQAGTIGEPIAATAFLMNPGPDLWHPNPEIFFVHGAGPLFDMGPYYLTSLVQFLGPAVRVQAMARMFEPKRVIRSEARRGDVMNVEVPTHVASTFEFASGAIATLATSWDVSGSRHRLIEIHGTEGTLAVPDPNMFQGDVSFRKPHEKEWTPVTPRAATIPQQRGVGLAEMAWAAQAGRPHRASGELALHAVDMMASAIESTEARRAIDMTTTCAPAPLLREDVEPNTFD
jgi:predicted dehydrogenase